MSITEISAIEHMRKRPGMYIGTTDFRGFKRIILDLFDDLKNNISDFEFRIEFQPNNNVRIDLDGITLEKYCEALPGSREWKDIMNNMGMTLLVALSSKLTIRINENNEAYDFLFEDGELIKEIAAEGEGGRWMRLDFELDHSILQPFEYDYDAMVPLLHDLAFLNPHVKIISRDRQTDDFQQNVFHSPNGTKDEVERLLTNTYHGNDGVTFNWSSMVTNYWVEVSMVFCPRHYILQSHLTFANNEPLYRGGALLNGITRATKLAINGFYQNNQDAFEGELELTDRSLQDNIIIRAVVKGESFEFEGATKERLGMPELEENIANELLKVMSEHFAQNTELAHEVVNLFMVVDWNAKMIESFIKKIKGDQKDKEDDAEG